MIPMTAVIGGIGTFAAWIAVTALHSEARDRRHPVDDHRDGRLLLSTASARASTRARATASPAPERPADFEELEYRTALVPIFGDDVSASALISAAKLIGEEGVVYAIFVLPVPSQLSLESGLEEEEAQGRSVLESARIQARRAGIKIHTGLIRTRNPGSALVEEAERVGSDVIYWSTIHAPAGEQRIGPTAAYLLSKRPCRVIIETENRPARSRDGALSRARRPRALGAASAERSASSQLGVAELVAEHERLGGHHARAGGDDLGHLAVEQRAARSRAPAARAGRCSARPSAFENSRLVTGSGAVALTGPLQRSSSSAARIIPTRSSRVDPGDVLAPAGDRPADAEPEGRQHLRERAAVRGRARRRCARARRACPARAAAAASASQSAQTSARKSRPAGASSSSGSAPWGP